MSGAASRRARSRARKWLRNEAAINRTADYMYTRADENKNGSLDRKEGCELLRVLFKNTGLEEPDERDMDDIWHDMQSDDDDRTLSRQEFQEFLFRFCSDELDAEEVNNLSALKASSNVQTEFLEVLKREYINNESGAVGQFFDRIEGEVDSSTFRRMEATEDAVREACDESAAAAQAFIENLEQDDRQEQGEQAEQIDQSDEKSPIAPDEDVKAYLTNHFEEVTSVCGLLVARTSKSRTAPVFKAVVSRFKAMLLEDGIPKNAEVCQTLKDRFVFLVGSARKLERHEDAIGERFEGRYAMAMKIPEWPFNGAWEGQFEWDQSEQMNTSCWRPAEMCAVWEETFHTVTEAYNRLSASDAKYGNWVYSEGEDSPLGVLMRQDIDEGTYETEKQNREENGQYDFITAINEWVHQIWVCWVAGHRDKLSPPQLAALDIIQNTPGMPAR